MIQLRHELASVNNIRLHYVIAGSGPPVYLLHGWPQAWFEWEPFIEPLAEKHTVVVPDLRGFGDSDKPASGYDLGTLASDLVCLAAHLSHERIVIVAHDLGGPVAYATAASSPGLVRGLLLFEAPLYGVNAVGVPDYERDYWHFGFHASCPDLAEALIVGKEDVYLQHFFTEFSYRKDAFSPQLVERFLNQLKRPGALRGGFAHYRAIKESRSQMKQWMTQKLAIPVGGFGGAHSLALAVLRSVERISEQPFGGVIESCGHWVCEESPKVVLNQIERLLMEIGTW